MNWDRWDFLFAGTLVAAVVLVFMVLKARKPDNTAYKSAVGLALAAAFILIWVNGAVGIIGAARNDANMMYGGVLAVGSIGASEASVPSSRASSHMEWHARCWRRRSLRRWSP
jgi:hypothetical protein